MWSCCPWLLCWFVSCLACGEQLLKINSVVTTDPCGSTDTLIQCGVWGRILDEAEITEFLQTNNPEVNWICSACLIPSGLQETSKMIWWKGMSSVLHCSPAAEFHTPNLSSLLVHWRNTGETAIKSRGLHTLMPNWGVCDRMIRPVDWSGVDAMQDNDRGIKSKWYHSPKSEAFF